jgi:hypothetical protein
MALAWAPLAIVLLLLPGIFFFIGLASYERLSREIIRSSVISEIAMATAIAIAIHYIAISLLSVVGFRLSEFVTPLATYSQFTPAWVKEVTSHLGPSIVYLGVTTFVGFCLGCLVAIGVVAGPLRRIAHHKWIYDIIDVDRKGGIITAFVMTTIVEDSKILMYKGRLHDIFLGPDGKISYLILKNCSKYFMALGEQGLVTSKQLDLFGAKQGARPDYVWDRLLIDGSNIANVLFDSSAEIKIQAEGTEMLDAALRSKLESRAQEAGERIRQRVLERQRIREQSERLR